MKLGTKHPLVKGVIGLTNKDHSVIKMMIVFSSPNQRYGIIIALSKPVNRFELVYQVSDVAHGPLVFKISDITGFVICSTIMHILRHTLIDLTSNQNTCISRILHL